MGYPTVGMQAPQSPRLRWTDLYREADLYKAAIRLYTKPLFNWRKALSTSTDERTLYDFARRGLQNLHGVHNALASQRFHYRPGRALRFNFNGKERTLYVYPWEERLVDLLLYRLLTRRLDPWFSPHSYAYRDGHFGVDVCQRRIARALYADGGTRFVVKRDISDYFGSVDHELLLEQLRALVEPSDFLYSILRERVRFVCQEGTARRGIPFGTAVACLFANIHLTGLDRSLEAVPGLDFFRYADDFLLVSGSRASAEAGMRALDEGLAALRLRSKPSHERQLWFGGRGAAADRGSACAPGFEPTDRLRHLGLEFRADGVTRLSRDKFRRICNRFRFAFRRQSGLLRRTKDPLKRAAQLVRLSREVLERGIRNVAIIDYYLRHVDDEAQLRLLDRWLAEEVLSLAFAGGPGGAVHRKGSFKKLSFRRLREMGLPSLVHRRRLIRHGHVESTFLAWRSTRISRGSGGAAVRPEGRPNGAGVKAFSPDPEAAVAKAS